MASTKKSTATKTTSKKKSTKRKSSVKKGKVYIAPYKIVILCSIIIAICMAFLLAISLLSNSSPKSSEKKEVQVSISERFKAPAETKDLKRPYSSNSETTKASEPSKNTKTDSTATETTEKRKQNTSTKTAETTKASQSNSQTSAQKTAQTSSKNNTGNGTVEINTKPAKAAELPAPTEKKQVPPSTKTEPLNKPEEKPAPKPQNTETPKTKSDFGFPVAKNGAQLIFVFDDGGQNLNHLDSFLKLPFPITVAVLPQIIYSKETAAKVRNSGNEVILHQPMQSVNPKVNPGPGAITPDMSDDQIKTMLFQNINEIGPIAGLNNHEGSAITADAEKMAVILQLSAEQSLYFLDSRTNVETKVPYVSTEMGYSYYERNIFLDNEKTKENALKELNKGLALANKNGSVIMIGHIWSADFLPALLQEVYPELKAKGYTFSVVSKSKAKKN